jgi:hypothetical protein
MTGSVPKGQKEAKPHPIPCGGTFDYRAGHHVSTTVVHAREE